MAKLLKFIKWVAEFIALVILAFALIMLKMKYFGI